MDDFMNETELNRLRDELAKKYRELTKESAKLDKDLEKTEKKFNPVKEKNRIIDRQNNLKELMSTIENVQKTIAVDSTSSVDEQKAAIKKLKELEKKYNFKTTNCKTYNINRPLYNTLLTHHNRSVEKNYKHPISAFLKKAGLALIPLAAIPLLPALGLGAIGAALATPLAWAGIALGGRAVVHAAQGAWRRGAIREVSKAKGLDVTKGELVEYGELYPTQSNVKGFFRTLGYNRFIKRTAGNTFDSLNELKEYKNFKGGKFGPKAPEPTDSDDKEDDKTDDKTKDKTKTEDKDAVIDKFIDEVKALDITKKDEVLKVAKKVPDLISYVTKEKNDVFKLTMNYLKLANMIHGKTINAEMARMLVEMSKPNPAMKPEYEALRSLYFGKLADLCKALGYDESFMKTYFGDDKAKDMGSPAPKGPAPAPGDSTPPTPPAPPAPPAPTDDKAKKAVTPPPAPKPVSSDEESFARTPELMNLLNALRSFDTSLMTMENYNRANKIIAKIDTANRVHSKDFHLDADDEMILAEVRSMAEAYESKTALVDKLKVCEAAMAANAFYKEAFEDCIKEFYNIAGHSDYVMDGKKSTTVRTATSRNLLSRAEYERVKAVLEYYKKYSTLTNKSGYADDKVQEEESIGRRR